MSSTHEERNARRRINDRARRQRIAEERAERLVLLEENNELKMRVLELEKDNATMKALLISYEKDLQGITARQIYEMKHPKKKVDFYDDDFTI